MEKQLITQLELEAFAKLVDGSGRSRRDIAADCNISMGFLSMMLSGKRTMSIENMNNIAKSSNIDLKDAVITQ